MDSNEPVAMDSNEPVAIDSNETFAEILDARTSWQQRTLGMLGRTPEEWQAPAAEILEGLEALVDAVRVSDPKPLRLRQRLLLAVAAGRPVYLADLQRREHVSASAVSMVAAQLEREGLVVRFRDVLDRRHVRIRATEAGRAYARSVREARCSGLARWLRWLPPEQVQALVAASEAGRWLAQRMSDTRPGGAPPAR